ncbi:MAG TPA: anti-sigma factor [Marmoricola sp.]|nr:anti-sigma factor [Marmoricola sp.]
MADDELTPAEAAEIERVRGMLADPAMWAEPPAELQERIVAAIGDERASRGRRRPWLRYAIGAAAAAVVLAGGATVVVQSNQDHALTYAASLHATDLAAHAKGDVTLTKTASGWRIELHATGLPRRADGEFYEAWLKKADGTLVPIGTFNDGRDVILWAGVGPADFPLLTITREVADGNQASSGQVVLAGRASES